MAVEVLSRPGQPLSRLAPEQARGRPAGQGAQHHTALLGTGRRGWPGLVAFVSQQSWPDVLERPDPGPAPVERCAISPGTALGSAQVAPAAEGRTRRGRARIRLAHGERRASCPLRHRRVRPSRNGTCVASPLTCAHRRGPARRATLPAPPSTVQPRHRSPAPVSPPAANQPRSTPSQRVRQHPSMSSADGNGKAKSSSGKSGQAHPASKPTGAGYAKATPSTTPVVAAKSGSRMEREQGRQQLRRPRQDHREARQGPLLDSAHGRGDALALPDRRHRRAKIDATRARLRARAESDGGAAALEVFEPSEGKGAPDHEALLAAIPAMSLTESRRYLLADGVERWRDRQLDAVAAAIAELPPDLTVVLIARAKAPAKLAKAVKAAKGEIARVRGAEGAARCRGPWSARRSGSASASSRPPRACWSIAWAPSPVRLRHELERLALWAGEGGEVTAADLDAMIADTSEAAVWSLLRCPAGAATQPPPLTDSPSDCLAQGWRTSPG